MEYKEALGWLLSRTKIDFEHGVARVKWLLNELGNPQESYPTVHFVGTNGKGSTLNALAEILMASGYRVGRFSSPSIFDYREQIVCQQTWISKDELSAIVTQLCPLVERIGIETEYGELSEFEILVAIAFVFFTKYQPVDIVLVEAGMGGLLDATNVLHPLVVVCPSIGLDHQEYLGETYAEIARQKIGVLQPGVPLVYASSQEEVCAVFEAVAMSCRSQTYALERDFSVQGTSQNFRFTSPLGEYSQLAISMKGHHQLENAALALMTVQLLKKSFPRIANDRIKIGLKQAVWKGRIEFLAPNLLVDGAHNNESIAALCDFLETEYAHRNIHFLVAAIQTKPIQEMLYRLSLLGEVTVTTFNDSRALSLDSYPKQYQKITDVSEWINKIRTDDMENLYVVTGSLYFIREIRPKLLK